jgi:hypothetical protein
MYAFKNAAKNEANKETDSKDPATKESTYSKELRLVTPVFDGQRNYCLDFPYVVGLFSLHQQRQPRVPGAGAAGGRRGSGDQQKRNGAKPGVPTAV